MRLKVQASTLVLGVCFAGITGLSTLLLIVSPGLLAAQNSTPAHSAAGTVILHPAETGKLLPGAVFFRGQSASVQVRNSGGLKFPDGMLVLSAMVDTSGYSTGLQQKYQAYLITEAPLDIEGKRLPPGAYGVGFIQGNHFVVMDLGAHDLFMVSSTHDSELKRPTPFRILADSSPGKYRLYLGRNYAVFSRVRGE